MNKSRKRKGRFQSVRTTKPSRVLNKDAVLLIPEPEAKGQAALYDIIPGYYAAAQLLELLDRHKANPEAILFLADMLETGNPDDDGFADILRRSRNEPEAIASIVQTFKAEMTAWNPQAHTSQNQNL